MVLDAWISHIITSSHRGYVVTALIQSLLQLFLMPRLVAFHIRFTQAISLVHNDYHASFRRPIPMRRLALGKRGA